MFLVYISLNIFITRDNHNQRDIHILDSLKPIFGEYQYLYYFKVSYYLKLIINLSYYSTCSKKTCGISMTTQTGI